MSGLLFLLCFGGIFALIVLSVISSVFRRLWGGNQPTYYASGYEPPPRYDYGWGHGGGYEKKSSWSSKPKSSSSSSWSSKPKSFGGPKWSSGGKKGGGAKSKW